MPSLISVTDASSVQRLMAQNSTPISNIDQRSLPVTAITSHVSHEDNLLFPYTTAGTPA